MEILASCARSRSKRKSSRTFPTCFTPSPTARLVERLANHFGDGKVFLGNSGAEANEAAIKLARRWGNGRFEILTTLGSFHGRTLATVTATGQERYHQGFQPLMPGFRTVPFDDLAALDRGRRDETVGVMIEPIQGEGGVVVPRTDYLKRVRDWCDRKQAPADIGRSGKPEWVAPGNFSRSNTPASSPTS